MQVLLTSRMVPMQVLLTHRMGPHAAFVNKSHGPHAGRKEIHVQQAGKRGRDVGEADSTTRQRPRSDQSPAVRRRVSPATREQMIVQGAVRFFAEQGFEGQTRELARRLGITQPLLYRYFPDKAALIDRVYREVFLDRWNPQWPAWIADPSRPLSERLIRFYQDYARVILNYEWVRLFMYSGLRGVENITKRYAEVVFTRIYPSVIGEVRAARGHPLLAEVPMTDAETEHLWALHAAIFYLGIRRWILGLPFPADQNAAVAALVVAFLDGAPRVMCVVAQDAAPPHTLVEAVTQCARHGGGDERGGLLSRC